MAVLTIYSQKEISNLVKPRPGETKFGERVLTIPELEALKTTDAKYVLFGIPEDIGVRANLGKPGTSRAWKACLSVLLNMQANNHTQPEQLVVLGEIDCNKEMQAAVNLQNDSPEGLLQLGKLVSEIDKKVTSVVEQIVLAGKIPVIIGGGHNNSYGNIKGTSFAVQHPINVLNFDAHSDFRALEHRHSGNGFSYAYEEGYLRHYYIFGLHKNYTSEAIFELLKTKRETISYVLYEQISVLQNKTFTQAMKDAEAFAAEGAFGLEIDMDAVASIPSSAKTPSGFTTEQVRRFVAYFSENSNVAYLHLCEAAPPENPEEAAQTGKLLAYLVTDFCS